MVNVLIERFAELPELAVKAHFHPGELAHLFGISIRTLERKCHEDLGMTPNELLLKLWCNKVKFLLKHKVPKEIHEILGNHWVCDFYRKFKKASGVTTKHHSAE